VADAVGVPEFVGVAVADAEGVGEVPPDEGVADDDGVPAAVLAGGVTGAFLPTVVDAAGLPAVAPPAPALPLAFAVAVAL
jgi:hypothetical protein